MMSQAQHIAVMERNAGSLKKILVVDDEPDINTIARIALETFGKFNVETCSSGIEALKKAEWFEPNLILLDVMMPFMDGEETLKKLKRNPKTVDIPVIFVTAKIFNRDVSKYKQLGALDVIPKPFDPVGLPTKIREIWTDFQVHERANLEIKEKLHSMREEFNSSLRTRLSTLRTVWANFLEEESRRSLMTVYDVVHKMVGLSGTVQHEHVFEISSQIEFTLSRYLEGERYVVENEDKTKIFHLISDLGKRILPAEHVS